VPPVGGEPMMQDHVEFEVVTWVVESVAEELCEVEESVADCLGVDAEAGGDGDGVDPLSVSFAW
jgi:hypothetical protein